MLFIILSIYFHLLSFFFLTCFISCPALTHYLFKPFFCLWSLFLQTCAISCCSFCLNLQIICLRTFFLQICFIFLPLSWESFIFCFLSTKLFLPDFLSCMCMDLTPSTAPRPSSSSHTCFLSYESARHGWEHNNLLLIISSWAWIWFTKLLANMMKVYGGPNLNLNT